MNAAFEFYEVVKLKESAILPRRLWCTEGVVVGKAQGADGTWEYAVQVFADNNECWQLTESDIHSTGKMMKRSDLYSEDSINVVVDPSTGEGSPLE